MTEAATYRLWCWETKCILSEKTMWDKFANVYKLQPQILFSHIAEQALGRDFTEVLLDIAKGWKQNTQQLGEEWSESWRAGKDEGELALSLHRVMNNNWLTKGILFIIIVVCDVGEQKSQCKHEVFLSPSTVRSGDWTQVVMPALQAVLFPEPFHWSWEDFWED